MTAGKVHSRRPLLPVTFRLTGQPDLIIEFQIDTGFNDYLTLPPQAIAAMGLPYFYQDYANLPDDSVIKTDVYVAVIVWDGLEIEVPVLATGRRPLLGAALLDGHELRARYAEGDLVTVEEL